MDVALLSTAFTVHPAIVALGFGFSAPTWDKATPRMHITDNVEGTKAKLAKLNKRAKRLGLDIEIGLEVIETHLEYQFIGRDPVYQDQCYVVWCLTKNVRSHERYTGVVREVSHCILTGVEEIKLEGWTFLAVLDHEMGEDNTIVRVVPSGADKLPSDWKHKNNFCDHCKRSQKRNQTFVCMNDDGRLMQVGSTCIRDFLGHDVSKILGHLEISAMIDSCFGTGDNEMSGFSRGEKKWDTVEFLAWVAKSIRENGWTSRGKARETSSGEATSDNAFGLMMQYERQQQKGGR